MAYTAAAAPAVAALAVATAMQCCSAAAAEYDQSEGPVKGYVDFYKYLVQESGSGLIQSGSNMRDAQDIRPDNLTYFDIRYPAFG
jgi:hypothetical protein